METTPDALPEPWRRAFGHENYLSLTTFRKDGRGVATPVWFAPGPEGGFCVWTREDSWKIKRLRNNPRAEIAPCTVRGAITGPAFKAHLKILPAPAESAAAAALALKYGVQFRVGRFFSRMMGRRTVFLSIRPEPAAKR